MRMKEAQKIAYIVNAVMLSMAFGLGIFSWIIKANFLAWFSIATTFVYLFTYYLVYKEMLEVYLGLLYGWLILYLGVATVCLGDSYGFQLYCFSMISVVYVLEYMSFKLGRISIRPLYISIGIALFYFFFMLYVLVKGPIYESEEKYAIFFRLFNSITVFGYLVGYTNYIVRAIIKSEKQLSEIAHIDRLTGLYNRHYMLDKLSGQFDDNSAAILAMADIDDFKKINDTYGHNAGDEVLKVISSKMRSVCKDCVIARWGGEEFLILCRGDESSAIEMLEQMRIEISSEPVISEGSSINVTITVGVSKRQSGDSIDEWIHQIDMKLYTGKKSGKNTVVA